MSENGHCQDHKCFRSADQECKQITCGRAYRIPNDLLKKANDRIIELETRCRELEKQLIIEIKSHLPIYAPEYVAKEMLKNRLDELSAITIDSIKGDQK